MSAPACCPTFTHRQIMNKSLRESQREIRQLTVTSGLFQFKSSQSVWTSSFGRKGVSGEINPWSPWYVYWDSITRLFHNTETTVFKLTYILISVYHPLLSVLHFLSAVQTQLFYLYALAWEYIYSGPMKQSSMKEHQFSLSNYPCACAALPANDR